MVKRMRHCGGLSPNWDICITASHPEPQGPLWKRGQKACKSHRLWMAKRKLSSSHSRAAAQMNYELTAVVTATMRPVKAQAIESYP